MSAVPGSAGTGALAAPRTSGRVDPSPVIGVREAVAIIVGVVIGAGIVKAPALVAGMAGSVEWMLAAWVLGGLISLVGARCYAELATAHPHAGGDDHFLHRALGRKVSLRFAWARFAVITTGSIAPLGFLFGDDMQQLVPLGPHGSAVYAAAAIGVLAIVNLRGLHMGAMAQSWLTLLEVVGLLLIVLAALVLAFGGDPVPAPTGAAAPPTVAAFGMAMIFVLLTYGGWNEAADISAELKDPPGTRRRGRAMVRALVISIVVITMLYLLVDWACRRGLGIDGMRASDAIAADLLSVAFGERGADRDRPAPGRLGHWDLAHGGPRVAMAVQGAAALLLVLVGALAGGGFRAMVEFTAPVFWRFVLLTGVALFVLRRREPDVERPLRVPLDPLLPALFVAVCGCMLWSSLSSVSSQDVGGINAAWIGVDVLAIGVALLVVLSRSTASRSPR
jgi:amino acid transporter